MAYRNVVVINGEKVDIDTLPKEERERLAREWNRAAAAKIVHVEEKLPKAGKEGQANAQRIHNRRLAGHCAGI